MHAYHQWGNNLPFILEVPADIPVERRRRRRVAAIYVAALLGLLVIEGVVFYGDFF